MTQIEYLKIEEIKPNPNNPRKVFEESSLAELAESIKNVGMLSPVIARKKGKKYELVCGERRYRASIIAKLDTIPAIIRDLSDDEAMDLMITENLQRKDINAIEESEAFNSLIKLRHYDVDAISQRFVKSQTYVRSRLILNNLIPEFKKFVIEDLISISSATVISRYKSEQQYRFYTIQEGNIRSGIMTKKQIVFSINKMFDSDLSKANFSLDDSSFNKAPACTACPNYSLNQLLQFENKEIGTCLDVDCYRKKESEMLLRSVEKAKKDNIPIVTFKSWSAPSSYVPTLKSQGVEITDLNYEHYYDIIEEPEKPHLDQYNEEDYDSHEELASQFNEDLEEYEEKLKEYNDKKNSDQIKKALCLTGRHEGKVISYIDTCEKEDQIRSSFSITTQVNEIRQKINRNLSLAREIIYAEAFQKKDELDFEGDLSETELKAIMAICFSSAKNEGWFQQLILPLFKNEEKAPNLDSYLSGKDISMIIDKIDLHFFGRLLRAFMYQNLRGNAQYMESFKLDYLTQIVLDQIPSFQDFIDRVNYKYEKKNESLQKELEALLLQQKSEEEQKEEKAEK